MVETYPSVTEVVDLRQWGSIRYHRLLVPKPTPITQPMVEQAARLIPPGYFVVDIGAWIGDTTIPYALAAGSTGKVLAFEPSPFTREILTENIRANHLDQVDICPSAVMDKPGMYTFHYTDLSMTNGGFSSMLDTTPIGCGNPVPFEVSALNLTEYLKSNYADWLSRWAFLKIDTEGYDKEILKSNAKIIREFKPFVQIEVYPFLSRRERGDLYDSIAALGYDTVVGKEVYEQPNPEPFDLICQPL